jgi:hypothetical protein
MIVRLTVHLSTPVVDHTVLGEDISLDNSLDLAFAEHMHGFIALNRLLHRLKYSKLQARVDTAFHQPMILFDDILQILTFTYIA